MKMRNTYTIIFAAALSLLCASCAKEEFTVRPAVTSELDNMGVSSQVQALVKDANQVVINLTAPAPAGLTKAASSDGQAALDAEVEFVSYKAGSNPSMSSPLEEAMNGTKAVFDPITTTSFNANFLRIDQKVGEAGLALDEWPAWNSAKVIEATTLSNPDNVENIHYRGIAFAPNQAYNIRVFGNEPQRDTIFYHSRMVGFHPMVCQVPRSGDLVSTIYFNNPLYAANLATVGGGYGVVFKNALNGSTDLMMSNCGEAQRWHRKYYGGKNIHYKATFKSDEVIDYSYNMPFGHNDEPEYSNPFFFKHYLSAVRIWAMVDQSGDGEQRAVNLQSWGQIQNISILEQPSTVTVSIPNEPTSAIVMEPDGSGRIRHESDGSVMVNKSNLIFGATSNWTDFANMPICGEKFYGETDVNHPDAEETTVYPVDMTKYANSATMDMTYLGYFLIKPCGSDDEIILAIKTAGGIYRAKIPALYTHEDGSTETIFQEGNVYDVVLNLRTAGTFTEFIENEDESEYENLSPYDNLNNTYKCANSYIIDYSDVLAKQVNGKAGYCFIASMMGNGPAGVFADGNTTFPTTDASIKGMTTAKLLWSSAPDLISNVQLQHSYIRFYVDHPQIGNAIIAVLDSNGEILWSWHIWITDVPDDVVLGGAKYMDRNLGATFNPKNNAIPANDKELCNSYGLYYQWGRKDPLPAPITNNISATDDNSGSSLITPIYDATGKEILELTSYDREGSIENSIKNPDKMLFATNSAYYDNDWIAVPNNILWGKEVDGKPAKSIYDPCPFGYRVPADEVQRLFSVAYIVKEISAAGKAYGLCINNSLYLPYAGFAGDERSASGHNATYRYVGRKGDYQSSLICPSSDATAYSWYTNHRLRTYLSATTSWTETGIDDGPVTFSAPNHYVVTGTGSNRDYTNRSTAASVRCVRDESYKRAGETSLSINERFLENNLDIELSFRAEINEGTFSECCLVLTPDSGEQRVINLMPAEPSGVTRTTWDATHRIGTYTFNTGTLGSISKYDFSIVMRDDAGN
ncbi:MAG: hypothetical protein MJY62_06655, partial [Bacteroidales bacterium]|nr:hypothetical protein [Bacteroidales bacterium]